MGLRYANYLAMLIFHNDVETRLPIMALDTVLLRVVGLCKKIIFIATKFDTFFYFHFT